MRSNKYLCIRRVYMNKQRAKGKNPVRMTEGEKTLCFQRRKTNWLPEPISLVLTLYGLLGSTVC